MKKTVLTLTLAAAMLMVSSCASKKDLQKGATCSLTG